MSEILRTASVRGDEPGAVSSPPMATTVRSESRKERVMVSSYVPPQDEARE